MEELLPLLAEASAELKPVLETLREISGAFGSLSSSLNILSAATGAFSLGMDAVAQAVAAPLQQLNLFSQGLGAVTQAVVQPFQQLGSVITPFVQALNPSLVFGFNQAMRSLQATVGVALVPVMEVLTSTVREFSGILLPAMQDLAPIFRNMAATVTELLMPPLRLIGDLFQALAPVLDFVTGVLRVVAEAWNALSVVARTVYQTFYKLVAELFGGTDLKNVLKGFRDAMHQVVEAVLKLVGYIAKAFGQFDFIGKMSANLREMAQPKAGAPPAPQDVGFKGFEDIAKTMAVSAFAAMGGGGAEDHSEKEWLQHLSETLDGIANDKTTLKQYVSEALKEWWGDQVEQKLMNIPQQIADAISTATRIGGGAAQSVRGFGAVVGDDLRRAVGLPGTAH